jgi:indole-3-acetate monooxygenase
MIISERATPIVDSVRQRAAQLAELSQYGEDHRRLSPETVAIMGDLGLFHILVPERLGGSELDLLGACAVIEELSAADAAAGWCLLKVSSTNMLSANFPEAVAREIWPDQHAVACGSLNPKGRAVKVDGGYRLTGRWDWGTASPFATWLMGGAMVFDDGADMPAMGPHGPQIVTCFFPVDQAEMIDTWHTNGMRGTGSGDFAVTELFIPERHVMSMGMPPAAQGELFKIPMPAWMMIPHAFVSIGIARAAVESLVELSRIKTPLASSKLLKDKEWVQDSIARATALVHSARAYCEVAVRDAWADPNPTRFTHLSLASTHAAQACVDAVDLVHRAAGGSAAYLSSPLQRQWRDVHTAASHFLVNVEKFAGAGRALLDPMVSPIGPT